MAEELDDFMGESDEPEYEPESVFTDPPDDDADFVLEEAEDDLPSKPGGVVYVRKPNGQLVPRD